MGQYDVAAAALLAVFAYGGYRRGATVFVIQLAGGLLAFALAAILAPVLAPHVAVLLHVPEVVARPVAVVVLTAALRFIFGFAVRELATALRAIIHAIPPLAALDHLLGIVPGLALGVLFVLALTVAALTVPIGLGVHDAAEKSWVARSIISRPDEALATARRLWERLVVGPPRLSALPLAVGIGGLWLGAFAAWRMRPRATERALREAPTHRISPTAGAAGEAADPLALPRAALGVLTAGAAAAALLALALLRG